jgi:NADPH:quinone reductase-like Zn-dependent oxidoreductase
MQNAQIVYKNISLTGFGIRGYLASKSKEERSAIAAQLVPIIAEPDFQLEAGAHYPMTDIKKALADDQQRDHRKIFLAF